MSFDSSANVFSGALSLDDVRQRAPAVFAPSAHERTSAKYTFIPTERVLSGLMSAGFVPVEARQAQTRRASPHARAARRCVCGGGSRPCSCRDAVPEVVFLNSHDGTSAYQLRMGIFRVVCTNGLIVSQGAFPAYCVSHRGDVVDEVVTGALEVSERFGSLAAQVERMEQRPMLKDEQIAFRGAGAGPAVSRLGGERHAAVAAPDLPAGRRTSATTCGASSTACQENLLVGGLSRRAASGRLTRTRRITSIREDVRLNGRLWDLAAEVLAA